MTGQETNPNRAKGAQPENDNAKKSGRYALNHGLRRHGFTVLSRKQREAVADWRQQIYEDRGGREALSQLQLQQIEKYLVMEVLIQHLQHFVLTHPSINKSKKTVYPVVLELNRMIETSMKLASSIGLDRKARPARSIADIAKDAESQPATSLSNSEKALPAKSGSETATLVELSETIGQLEVPTL